MRHALPVLALVVALSAFTPQGAHAFPRPDLAFTAGTTLGVAGDPNSGGLSLSATPLWNVNDRFAFGITIFADDMGTGVSDLRDANSGLHIGTIPTSHRWTYGGAWRADATVLRHKKWTADAVGQWGYYRLEDDLRGAVSGAASTVGFGLGANLRHATAAGQEMGLAARYNRLFTDRSAVYSRVDHYASLALEWRWAGTSKL